MVSGVGVQVSGKTGLSAEDWGLSKKACLAADHFNMKCRFPP
jgi:hypothetical protein